MAKRAAKKQADAKRVKIKLVKSTIGFDRKQAAIVEGARFALPESFGGALRHAGNPRHDP
jgi:hypothetical protein